MSKPHSGKSGLKDYLYYQLNQGDGLESPNDVLERKCVRADICLNTYEIGLIAATQAEAGRFLGLVTAAMQKHLPSPTKHRFKAYGLDQAWRPLQLFDEVHWFNSSSASLPPQELLASLGSIVHIHLFERCEAQAEPGFRTYRWESERDLTEFWASIYLSRELCWFLDLDWKSYFTWQPRVGCHAKVDAAWGVTPKAATDALLSSARTTPTHSDGQILIIEGGLETSFGDYVDIVNTLEKSLDLDLITTGWGSPNYSGYGLKLLRFCHP